VISNKKVGEHHYRLTLKAPAIAGEAKPGQFIMLYLNKQDGVLLPRPFSIYLADKAKGEIVLLFEVRGCGTNILAKASEGSFFKVMGPLGRNFPNPSGQSLLLAGGMGIAPLVFLAASARVSMVMIYGAKTNQMLVCPPEDLINPMVSVIRVTEDGSFGEKGTCLDFLEQYLANTVEIYACGPMPMLSTVADLGKQHKIKAWLSLEERMACGIGACLGCVTATAGGYKRVCADGPVFPAEEVFFGE